MLSDRWRGVMAGGWLVLLSLAMPDPAFALQTHAYEGLYLHQLAHLFFLAAMIFFALGIQQSRLVRHRSWRLMAAGGWLLALWNIWAFGGHFVEVLVPEESLLSAPGHMVPRLAFVSWREILYYLVEMDHLLAVPAIFCFYFGMRGLYRTLGQENGEAGGGGA